MPLVRCPECDERFNLADLGDRARCPNCGARFMGRREAGPRRALDIRRQTNWKPVAFILGGVGLFLLLGCAGIIGLVYYIQAPTSFPTQTEDYVQARARFKTKLVQRGPAPSRWNPEQPPPEAREVDYTSAGLRLKAWVSAPPIVPNRRQPAVLYLHNGFAFGEDDWDQAEPFRRAGFVVMVPMLRGENGLPGSYSMFYDEVDDVLAAAQVLAQQPGVDSNRLYVAGHSVGGTLAMLAALTSNRFRAGASFSGSPDQVSWSRGQEELVPFDRRDQREMQMRSPLAFPRSFKCPFRIYYGNQEWIFKGPSEKTAQLAAAAGLDVAAVSVPGDHGTSVPAAMRQAITFFQQR